MSVGTTSWVDHGRTRGWVMSPTTRPPDSETCARTQSSASTRQARDETSSLNATRSATRPTWTRQCRPAVQCATAARSSDEPCGRSAAGSGAFPKTNLRTDASPSSSLAGPIRNIRWNATMFDVAGRYSSSCGSSSHEMQYWTRSRCSGKRLRSTVRPARSDSRTAPGSSGPDSGMCRFTPSSPGDQSAPSAISQADVRIPEGRPLVLQAPDLEERPDEVTRQPAGELVTEPVLAEPDAVPLQHPADVAQGGGHQRRRDAARLRPAEGRRKGLREGQDGQVCDDVRVALGPGGERGGRGGRTRGGGEIRRRAADPVRELGFDRGRCRRLPNAGEVLRRNCEERECLVGEGAAHRQRVE